MKITSALAFVFVFCLNAQAQLNSILLGRPTQQAITASVLFESPSEFYIEYGIAQGQYVQSTSVFQSLLNVPEDVELTGLQANTRYYYRLHHRAIGSQTFTATPEYSFQTQRPSGESFVFTLEADEHLYDKKGSDNLYQVCLNNQVLDNPDFMISLGDIFGDDHTPDSITSAELDDLHRYYRPFLGTLCHSVPFYVCLGNHEGENDFYLAQNPPNNLAVWATQWRKAYYPNPAPNEFYTGNETIEGFGIENPENYYAWTWGDALFVVLDVYRDQCDTSAKPKTWDWTLGLPQYNWLKTTLEESTAEHKFVFAHHVRGQDRGGVTCATKFEWGGYQQNGQTYTFDVNRPDMAMPIHQLFVENGVDIFFQGHDHVFAHEVLDNIVYQTAPMAADSTYEIGMLANADAFVSDTLDGSGHLRISVQPGCVTVDFVRAYLPQDTIGGVHTNGEVAFSYTLGSCNPLQTTETTENEALQIWPNPASGLVYVAEETGKNPESISVYDATGRMLLQSSTNRFDTGSFPDGLYFVRAQINKRFITQKLLVKHNN